MGASRVRRTLSVGAAAAAVVVGVLVAPVQPALAAGVPGALSPNDPAAAPSSPVPGTPLKNGELTWSSTGAAAYQVQISDAQGHFPDDDYPSRVPAVDTTVRSEHYPIPSDLPRGDWAWRVREAGNDDNAWPAKPAWFTKGWADAPDNPEVVAGDTSDTRGPVLTWDAMPDASYYEVQFSLVPFHETPGDAGTPLDPDKPEESFCVTQGTVFSPYRTVRGSDEHILGSGDSEEDVYRCVEIGATADLGIDIHWRVRGRDGAFDARATGAARPAEECAGVWYNEVPAESHAGSDCSEWGYPDDTFSNDLDVDPNLVLATGRPAPPATPSNPTIGPRTSAAGSPAVVTNTPVYSWDRVPGATFYRVHQFTGSQTPTLRDAQHAWETTATALSVVTNDQDTTTRVWWAVQACTLNDLGDNLLALDYEGGDGLVDCSAPTTFRPYTKHTPDNVQAISKTTSKGSTVLSWSTLQNDAKPYGSLQLAVSEAAGYRLQVSGYNGDFKNPSLDIRVDRVGTANGVARWPVATKDLPAGWTWRVRAIDQSGNPHAWSTPPAKAPIPPPPPPPPSTPTVTLVAKSGLGAKDPIAAQFSEGVKGVSSSTLRLVAQDGRVAPATLTRQKGHRWVLRPRTAWAAGAVYRLSVSSAIKNDAGRSAVQTPVRRAQVGTTVNNASDGLTVRKGDRKWRTLRSARAKGGTYLVTKPRKKTKNPSWVQTTVYGSKIKLFGCRTPNSGKARIFIDGRKVKTKSLYKKSTKCGKIGTFNVAKGKAHTVRFQPTGTKKKKSKGRTVRFDAIRVS